MKYIALLFLFCSEIADASFPGTGIGLTLGAPSGFSGRTSLSENESLGFGAGWSIVQNHHFEFFGDYLWNRPDAFEINGEKFDFFFGGGLVSRTNSGKGNELVFGPRLPVGTSYQFTKPDLELFAVFAVNIGVVPSADVFLDLHLGARFYVF